MFNQFKLPIWNEITLELGEINKIKKAQLIPLNPKLYLLLNKEQSVSQIFVFHSSIFFYVNDPNHISKPNTELPKLSLPTQDLKSFLDFQTIRNSFIFLFLMSLLSQIFVT